MNLYPRSFLRLVMVGWFLIALPLLAAIGYVAVGLNQLAERGDAAVHQASQTARLGWELPESIAHMERSLRQYEILGDASILEDYDLARGEWRRSCQEFAQVPMVVPSAPLIARMLEDEEKAYRQLSASGGARPLRDVLLDIKARTFDLLDVVSKQVALERQAFRESADELRQRMLLASLLALFLAAGMFLFGRHVVARLLRRVERAVVALGQNQLDRRISLKGPDDLKWIGQRLEWLRRRLATLERERTSALRHMSHELKTPLAALREGASLLAEGVAGPLAPRQEKIAAIIQSNSARLDALIDGLLRLQQAEHARERIEARPIRLDELVQQVLQTQQIAARDKRLRITGSLAPLSVMGGVEALTTVVGNLISNAVKFSPERGTVQLALARDGSEAVMDVTDQGPGVPEADRDRIFEPFFRSPHTKSVAGVGLGLAIAHEFAAAHQGSLSLVPSDNGAHFRLRLPLPTAVITTS